MQRSAPGMLAISRMRAGTVVMRTARFHLRGAHCARMQTRDVIESPDTSTGL